MMKMLKFAASMAMAIVLMSCGCSKDKSSDAEKEAAGSVGSAKEVAESFVNAILEDNGDKILQYCDVSAKTETEKAAAKTKWGERVERKLRPLRSVFEAAKGGEKSEKARGTAILEVITGDGSYTIEDGKKRADKAYVIVQLVKGKVKSSGGVAVELVSVDGSWKVTDLDAEMRLDTAD